MEVVGECVLGRFQLVERLGSGGFGVVYRAWDEQLQRPVAVKAIERAVAPTERVLREAQAAARLNHPGIVALYELGDEGDHAYLVTELVEGRTLAELGAAGELSDRDVGAIGADLCDALEHAHGRGVVHRDLKPGNVLVAGSPPRAKLLDFGIARLAGGDELTATGAVLGTLAYMAPEQAEGGLVDGAADVYSLALSLYESWTGENPVRASGPAATARRIGKPLESLSELRPDLPPELVEAIDACLLPSPQDRLDPTELGTTLGESLPLLNDEDSLRPAPFGERLRRAVGLRRKRWLVPAAIALVLAGPVVSAVTYAWPLALELVRDIQAAAAAPPAPADGWGRPVASIRDTALGSPAIAAAVAALAALALLRLARRHRLALGLLALGLVAAVLAA